MGYTKFSKQFLILYSFGFIKLLLLVYYWNQIPPSLKQIAMLYSTHILTTFYLLFLINIFKLTPISMSKIQ